VSSAQQSKPVGTRRSVRVPSAGRSGERGTVTAETAMVLPLLVGVALGLVWVLSLALTQVRLVDAARETARAAARDETSATAVGLGRRVAPAGARVTVRREPGRVVVVVSTRVDGLRSGLGLLPTLTLHAEAVAGREQQ
jgi:Flp pilus assembly protein TadG